MTYLIVEPDGNVREEETEGIASLQKLQSWVDGYIECVWYQDAFDPSTVLIVNEDGRRKELPPNTVFPALVGPVVIARRRGEDLVGLTPAQIRRWQVTLQELARSL